MFKQCRKELGMQPHSVGYFGSKIWANVIKIWANLITFGQNQNLASPKH